MTSMRLPNPMDNKTWRTSDMAQKAMNFAKRLRAGETIFNATTMVPGAMIIETFAAAGFQSITLDIQHGFYDYETVLMGIASASSMGASTLVRVGLDDVSTAARCLDAGAAGVLIPMVNTQADVDRLVAATKYPPLGQRSWGPGRSLASSGLSAQDYLNAANRSSVVFAMIETQTALDNIELIAGHEGIDGLFVGPLDLSISLSQGGRLDPGSDATRAAMEKVANVCARHGKTAGAFAATDELAHTYMDQGYRFMALALDVSLIRAGAEAILGRFRGMR